MGQSIKLQLRSATTIDEQAAATKRANDSGWTGPSIARHLSANTRPKASAQASKPRAKAKTNGKSKGQPKGTLTQTQAVAKFKSKSNQQVVVTLPEDEGELTARLDIMPYTNTAESQAYIIMVEGLGIASLGRKQFDRLEAGEVAKAWFDNRMHEMRAA